METKNLLIAVEPILGDFAATVGRKIRKELPFEVDFPLLENDATDTEAGALELAELLQGSDVVLAILGEGSERAASLAAAAVALDLEVIRWELTPLNCVRTRCPLLSHPRVWRVVGSDVGAEHRLFAALELAALRDAVRRGLPTVRDWQAVSDRLTQAWAAVPSVIAAGA